MEKIKTEVAEIFVDEDSIVHILFPVAKVKVTTDHAQEIYDARMQLNKSDLKHLIFTDITSHPSPDRGARDFTKSSEMVNTTLAMAMLVGGPLSRVMGNFFIGLNKGEFPVRLFSDKQEALRWLRSFK